GARGLVDGAEPHPLLHHAAAGLERPAVAGGDQLGDALARNLDDEVAFRDEGEELAARLEAGRMEDAVELDARVLGEHPLGDPVEELVDAHASLAVSVAPKRRSASSASGPDASASSSAAARARSRSGRSARSRVKRRSERPDRPVPSSCPPPRRSRSTSAS